MMPMYMSSSQQPGQMRPQGCYYQGFGNYPHHMTMDASSPASSCEHWPTPSPCYGSCVHGNFPVYTPYWSPCYPPQQPYRTCCANHSGFHPHPHAPPCYVPQPFPVGYQPGYCESEKDVTGKHRCTKCSPQMLYPKKDTSVVIEEHVPEIEKGDRGEAVNHVRSTNCPYPIIWIPHENAMNQERGSHDQPPAQIKAPESKKVQKCDPKSWSGCFPFDENTIKSLMQNQERNKMQNGKAVELPFDISKLQSLLRGQEGQTQKSKEPGQLQYPIFWIPSQGKQGDVEASEKREGSNQERNLKSFSKDHLNEGQTAQGEKGNFDGNVLSDAEEKSLMRNIPEKSRLQEPRNIPVKLLENHLPEPTKRIAKTEPDTKKEQRSSPPKTPRLPPVCLRVDPLPKRKNGGSKSLSPPRREEQALTSEETKDVSPLSSKKAETRTSPEACNVQREEANKDKKTSEGRPNPTGTEKGSVESKRNMQEAVNFEIAKPCEAKENKEKPAKKTFAEEEAARIIQSRYRGYDVRRWEPIKKLKEIATVREQMGDVKKRIEALELSADHHTEGKQLVVLGEMVMSLLLKLDSIQGLHPSIRDYRKSLARELSDIQDNIDSLKKSSEEKDALEEQVDNTSQTSDCPVSLENSQLAEENKMVFDSSTEKVCPPSPEEHIMSLKTTTDGQMVAEAEEGTGLSETLAMDPEPAAETDISEADSTTTPEKIEGVETVLPMNPSSTDGIETPVTNIKEDEVMVEKLEEPLPELPQGVEITRGPSLKVPENGPEISETVANASENEDRKVDDDYVLPSEKLEMVETVPPANSLSTDGNEMRVTNIEEDKVMVEKLEETHEVPQVVETTPGPGLEVSEHASEVSKTVANASKSEDRKGVEDSILPSEKDVVFSELPVGVIDDEKQLLSQDSLSCAPGAEIMVMDPEIASKEEKEINVDSSCDHSSGIDQETQVGELGMSEETKKLMEENQRFKETMETLVKAGREQLEVISKLTGRVKSLEKKLSQKKRTHVGRRKLNRGKKATKSMSAS